MSMTRETLRLPSCRSCETDSTRREEIGCSEEKDRFVVDEEQQRLVDSTTKKKKKKKKKKTSSPLFPFVLRDHRQNPQGIA
jgi:hypothetical protein